MMLDTMKIQLADYAIESENSLTVQPSSYYAGTGEKVSEYPLFVDSSRRVFRGSKAYLNTDKFNLTLKPFTRKEGTGTACFVQFSVPKVHNGENFYSVGEQGSRAVFKNIEKELWNSGIHCDIDEAKLSRVDTFKNVQTDEPYTSYYSLFGLLKARRALKRGYGTTFLLSNTQQEFTVYDKLEEMRSRGLEVSEYPSQTMRFEHRLLNRRKIKDIYGFGDVKSLFSGGYDVVKTEQVEQWKKSLFSYSVDEVLFLGSKQLEAEMRIFKDRYERNWFQYFLKAYGAYHLAQIAGIEVVKTALQNVEAERTKIYRTQKQLEEAKRDIEFVKQDESSKKTLGELYQELKVKVCLN